MLKVWFGSPLWARILLALVLGAIAGYFWGEGALVLAPLGEVFVRLIRMIVVPLVFVTIVAGVAGLANPKQLGSLGVKALILYALTTLVAVWVGLALGLVFEPGRGVTLGAAEPRPVAEAPALGETLMAIVPSNPVQALADGDMLAVIFFALLLGAGAVMAGERGEPVKRLFESASEVILQITRVVMEVAPFGVFALIAGVMGTSGPQTFLSVFTLAGCLIAGAIFQLLVVHGLLVRLFARLPVVPFFRGVIEAALVAFSTSSSSATLPASIRVAEKKLGIHPSVAGTVLPLGTTVSMDGTAIYVALLALFSAQVFGIDLNFTQLVVIAVTTTLVSIGTAPVPSASLFLLAAVLSTFGLTAEQTALIVGFILPFDRILDMVRTVPNVVSDLAVATTVGKWERQLDEDVYRDPKSR
jgi:Na+/H+-dicarboxylate symporter